MRDWSIHMYIDWPVWHICNMSIEGDIQPEIPEYFSVKISNYTITCIFPYPAPPPLKWLLDRSNKVDKWRRPIQHEWHNIDGPWKLMTYFAFSGFDYKHVFYINRLYSLNLITLEIYRRTFKVPSIKSSIAQINNLMAAKRSEFSLWVVPWFKARGLLSW